MFEGSLVESQHLLKTNSRWTTAISLLFQSTIAALLIGLPLLHPEVISIRTPKLTMLQVPIKPVQPRPVQTTASATTRATAPAFTAPRTIVPLADAINNEPPQIGPIAPMTSSLSNLPVPFATNPDIRPAIIVQQPKPETQKTLRISGGVAQGLLLTPLRPTYPRIAIATRTEGTVVVQAVISRSGTVESLHVVSGPTLLQNAALEAIREARYSPYRLDGDPVEVETTFSVVFKMGN